MRAKDVAAQLRSARPESHIVSPFPKLVTVYGGEPFVTFTHQGVEVEFRPMAERPSMFDRRPAAVL